MPQYYVENNHPPLISREAFEAAQQLQSGKQYRNQSKTRYPLSGKLFCSDCGHPFRRMMINKTAYWLCAHNASGRTQCQPRRFTEASVYTAFLLLVNKLAANREYILTPLISQLERMQNRNSNTQGKVYEIDRQIAELNQHNHIIAKHRSQGFLNAADYAAQSNSINAEVSTLRSQRRRILAEDENDEMIEALKSLDSTLSGLENVQTTLDEKLFTDIIVRITAVSGTELRFQLIGGLELTETISRTERRSTT